VAWGHSAIVNPWGTIIAETDEKEGIAQADIGKNNVFVRKRDFLGSFSYVSSCKDIYFIPFRFARLNFQGSNFKF